MEKEVKEEKSHTLRNLGIGFLIMLIIGFVGALITDYVLHAYITNLIFIIMIIIAILIAGFSRFMLKVPLSICIFFVIGVILIPYLQFFVGKMDLYAMDPPQLRESVSVTEIRLDMGDFYMKNDKGEDIAVMKDIPEKKLYVGGNKVHLGTINMPPGNYVSGKLKIDKVEVDVNIDIEKEAAMALSTVSSYLPAGTSQEQMKSQVKAEIIKQFNPDTFKKFAPSGINFKDIRNDGSKVFFTVSLSLPEFPIPFPRTIPYPTGTGGPDILLDIVLDAGGFPSSVNPIIKLPPGAPEINFGDFAPDINKMMSGLMPGNVGPSDSDIQSIVKQQLSANAGPGGCLSQAECSAYCSNEANRDVCVSFARSKGITIEIPEAPQAPTPEAPSG